MGYYDWNKTLSYAADVTCVVGARDIGKTYGLRLHCIKACIRNGWTYAELARFSEEVKDMARGYFDKLAGEPGMERWIFKSTNSVGYWAPAPKDEKEKIVWRPLVYFVALTSAQKAKKMTFTNVKYIIFDEALIERYDRYHSYLPREYETLTNLVDTMTRETVGASISPKVFLLGNAVDLVNPYFAQWGIVEVPEYGRRWYRKKTVLLDFVDPALYGARERATQTLAGRMSMGTDEEGKAIANRFEVGDLFDIATKTSNAKPKHELTYKRRSFTLWYDMAEGYIYVLEAKSPDTGEVHKIAITRSDMTINHIRLPNTVKFLKGILDLHGKKCVRFETVATREHFMEMLSQLGVR